MSEIERPADHLIQVLLVDDDSGVLHALEQALSDRPGQQITACSSFEEARKRLREQTFDVLITDVRLGAFNGLQLAVLARDVNPLTQLIVFSGFDDSVLRQEAERLGGTYLVKPVTTDTLQALITPPGAQLDDAII
jgi:YesN/AraC family two-component response regulator